ncbi:unnamed protein product [Alopecurus aequalis]
MSSLLRSPAIRRALSAASSGGSFLRAPPAAAPAVAGEGVAIVRRGLGLPTVPRRHLSGHGQSGQPPALSADQVNVLDQNLKKLQATVDNGFIICGTIRLLVEDGKLRNPFVQWGWMLGIAYLLSCAEQRMKSGKGE